MVVKRELKNEILVGGKQLSKYLLTFSILSTNHDNIVIKARGKYIPKAISLTEASKKLYGWVVDNISTFTEEVKIDDKVVILPCIEISLKKS